MVDNKNSNDNSKGSYAAVVGSSDNQPEGTVVASESQPPPYTASDAPGPSTQPPANPKHAAPSNQHYAQVHKAGQGSSAPLLPHHPHTRFPTPGQAESGMVVLVAHSPEYYYALSRARRRFWGALFWAFLIYLVAAAVVGGGVEDAYRHRHRGGHGHRGDDEIIINHGSVIHDGNEWASE